MLFQSHMSLGVLATSTTCAGLMLGSAGAAELREFSFNFALDAGLTSSSYEMGFVYGSLKPNESPKGISFERSNMNFS